MKQIFSAILFITIALFHQTLPAQPRIGLVLSGGGARGSAHIGVLKVLEELRIPIHAIAGTSMGALVGGTYASGMPLTEIERRVTGADWNELFNDDPPRPQWPARRKLASERPTWDFTLGVRDGGLRLAKGAIAGQKVQLFIADLIRNSEGIEHFDQLPIPFRAIATNLENGHIKVFDHGPLSQVLRASMSVPGLFAPQELDDVLYVDGGLVRNLPVDVARTLGVDVIIAVNLGSTYLPRDQLDTLVGVAGQMIAILTEQNVERSLAEIDKQKDVLITPLLGDITAADFSRAAEAIAAGEQAARRMAPRLVRYSLDEETYRNWKASRFSNGTAPEKPVDEVRIVGLTRVNDELFKPLVQQIEGKPLDRRALENDLNVLYGRADFEQLNYRLIRQDQKNLLIINALERSIGPGYLSFGLGFMSDYQGDTRFGARAIYNQTWVNQLGAEWLTELDIGNEPRLFTEFFQPIRLDRAGFIAVYLDIAETPLSLFLGQRRIARFDIRRSHLGIDIGTTFGTASELRLGTYLGQTDFRLDTGDPFLFDDGRKGDSGLRASFIYDTLDSPYVPTSGQRLALRARMPLNSFGANDEYVRLSGRWNGAFSIGPNSLVGTINAGTSLGQGMPYYDQFPLGGFLKLSGYANEQFRGNDMAYGNLMYYRRITSLPAPLGSGLYLGGSLEVGKVWNTFRNGSLNKEKTRYGSSIFFAADSIVGPFFIALGLSGEGDSTIYVLLGQP